MEVKSKKFVAMIFSAIILLSCIVFFQVDWRDQHQVLGVAVSPICSTFKLGVNESEIFTASALNGTGPYSFSWEINPSANLTLEVNNETLQLEDKLMVESESLTLCYHEATEDFVTITLFGTDKDGLTGQTAPFIVADPYTSPGYYFDASTSTISYIIQTDGLGWYRAINGETGAVEYSSTNAVEVVTQAEATLTSGGHIHFGNGTFPSPTAMLVPTNDYITYSGEGIGQTIIQQTATYSSLLYVNNFDYVSFYDMTIDGNGYVSSTAQLAYLRGGHNLRLERVELDVGSTTVSASCLLLNGVSDYVYDVWIEECYFHNAGRFGIFALTPSVNNVYNVFISNNRISNGMTAEVGGYGGIYVSAGNGKFTITNNILIQNGEYGIAALGTVGNIVSDNYIELSYYGVYANGDYNIVSNNKITNVHTGLHSYSTSGGFTGNSFTGNIIDDCTTGIDLRGTSGDYATLNTFSANVINATVGIYSGLYTRENIFIGNTIKAVENGITVAWIQQSIIGNTIEFDTAGNGSYRGIYLATNQAHDNLVEGNKIRTVTNGGYHICSASGALRNYILNNDVYDTVGTTPYIYASSTTTVVTGNKGFVTENSGSSTGTGSEQAIGHGLSYTPDYVWFSDKEDGANAYLSAASNSTHIHVTAVSGKDYSWKAEAVPGFT
ncbi:MAG: right-handed parallel beta-helix repeat-containing protein [Candidatus Bathyarchaeota archaeon]|nr:right-handed parallel beta-helix repeat-containing protein [Candidatus Bathyarchaeota archaeon]